MTRSGFTNFSPFAVSTYLALPVKWLSVNGRNDNKNNIINWTVASEENNDHYIIEVSTTGNNFTKIGKIKGAGTTNIEQRYSFIHYKLTEPVYYYRIKQVDIDGHYSYSKVVRIVTDNSAKNGIIILNNPVLDRLSVSIMVSHSFAGSINITDMGGKSIYKQKLYLGAGNSIIDLGSFHHPAGIYYLVFVDEKGNREVVKFIKK